MAKLREKTLLSPAALTLEVAIATNVLLAIVAVLLLVLALAFVGFWEDSTSWRAPIHTPLIQSEL